MYDYRNPAHCTWKPSFISKDEKKQPSIIVEYDVGDTVIVWAQNYVCLAKHRSGVFATDLIEHHYWKKV